MKQLVEEEEIQKDYNEEPKGRKFSDKGRKER
jgi:hypothetical protein